MNRVKIKNIGDVVTGKTPSTKRQDFFDGDILFVTPSDIVNGGYIEATERTITEEGLSSIKNNSISGVSVLVGCIGTIGCTAWTNSRCATNQQINSITNIRPLYNPLYVYYALSQQKNNLQKIAGTTVLPILPKSVFEEIELEIPDLVTQDNVVSILQKIDCKNRINFKINAELESLAKTIYDYWFLQFDFPNKEGKPYKSSGGAMVWNEDLKMEIPEGWEVTTLGKIIVEQPKSKIPVEDAKTAQGNIPFFTSGNSILKWDKPLVSGRNCYVNDGGNADVRYYIGETAYSTHTWCITGKNGTSDFLYLTLVTLKPELDIKYFQGSTLKNLNKSALKKRPFFIPPADVMTSFNKIIQPIFDMISENIRQNQELTNLRDFLLPLLMNGQVGFKDS